MFIFEPTLTLGALLQASVFLIGCVGLYYGLKGRLDLINLRVVNLETSMADLKALIVKVAVYDQRFISLEADIRELRHGKGYVVDDDNPPPHFRRPSSSKPNG